eukprot:TCONS_00051100-protein
MAGQIPCEVTDQVFPIILCTLSILLTIISVPLNGVVLVAIIKNKKFHSNFYFIIFNTTAADFLIGAILCPLSINIHVREIREEPVNGTVDTLFHFGLFTLAMVSVLTITVLSIDRMISLKFSSQYRVMKKINFIASLLAVWVVTGGLSPIYFILDYSLFLTIISLSAVLVTAVMMFITYMFYRAQLRRAFIRSHSTPKDPEVEINDADEIEDQGPGTIRYVSSDSGGSSSRPSIPMSIKRKFTRSKKDSITSITSAQKLDEDYQVYLMEKRATDTFFYMMLIFFLCYIPVVIISLTIHLSKGRYGCYTINLLQECIAILCIISSVCKTIVFVARLTALRKACINLFISDEEMERRWRKESVPMVPKKKRTLKDRLLQRKAPNHEEEIEKEMLT